MTHFPRWIDDDKVDSQAMFGAYLYYIRSEAAPEEQEDLRCLYSVVHAVRPSVVIGGRVLYPERDYPDEFIKVPCTTVGCARCSDLKGGYKSRWYDKRWGAGYIAGARAGAWKPY